MTILDRIKIIAKEQGLTISSIEEKLAFGKNSMYRWDTNSPSVDKVLLVANLLDTSIEYLITGNDKSIFSVPNNNENELIKKYNQLSEIDKNKIDIFIKSMQSLDNGDIGVFDIDGETTCKRFKYDSTTKTVILTSFNSTFKPLTYPLKNYQGIFRIIGKVILTDDQEDRYHSFIRK